MKLSRERRARDSLWRYASSLIAQSSAASAWGKIEHVAEDVGQTMLAIEAGQHGERAAELDLLDHHGIGRFRRAEAIEQIRSEALEAHPELLHAALLPVQQVPHGDAIRPGPNRRFSPEGVETGDHLDEDLLAGVARVLGTGRHAQCEPEDVILHGANHAFERQAIAGARGVDDSRQVICIDVSLRSQRALDLEQGLQHGELVCEGLNVLREHVVGHVRGLELCEDVLYSITGRNHARRGQSFDARRRAT